MTRHHHSAHPPRSLLGLWAHPDDESYLSAGLMQRTLQAGGRVTVVALTDGEAGFGDDDPRTLAERRALRRAELGTAMAAIGVTDIRFLGHPDGSLSEVPAAGVVDRLVEIAREVRPDVVVTFGPDGITGHDDHVTAGRLAADAWRAWGHGELWQAAKTDAWLDEWRVLHDELGIWMTEEPTGVPEDEIAAVLDLTPAELNRKRAALGGHASQSDVVAAAMGEPVYRRWIAQEAFRRAALVGAS
ncbi:PIG-L family deacetylase [Nocardioides sp. GY 10113]|uniref:PIG-L deacetylase family protein n=1 Tax=Nocardioides sp. GY 10113 TaxID=2569761 RepID=UPI0010A88520|nr:PIG-L family deacetylase [Nocardioides sp. GY 10113]TIC88890.1 PIG-L family deacetylase [Nocardioides sp. GY 10113]